MKGITHARFFDIIFPVFFVLSIPILLSEPFFLSRLNKTSFHLYFIFANAIKFIVIPIHQVSSCYSVLLILSKTQVLKISLQPKSHYCIFFLCCALAAIYAFYLADLFFPMPLTISKIFSYAALVTKDFGLTFLFGALFFLIQHGHWNFVKEEQS